MFVAVAVHRLCGDEMSGSANRVETFDDDFMREDTRSWAAFSSVFMHAPALVALFHGPEHVIEAVNPIYEKFFCDASSVGQPLSRALPQLGHDHGFTRLLDEVYRTGEPVSGRQWRIRPRNGDANERVFSFSYQPVYGKNRTVEGVTVFALDITAELRAIENLEELTANLEKAESDRREQDDFFAAIAHELRTPITSILGWARMLTSHDLAAPERLEAVTSIQYSATLLANIVEDLLDEVRATTGKLRLDMQPLDLSAVAEAAIAALRPAADEKGLRLASRITSACPIEGDFNRLQQAVWNVLANAVKFTPRRGTIEVTLGCGASHAVLEVCDTGIGMDAVLLPQIFERYRQADAHKVERRAGLGLGLGIARHIIELHGGELTASSAGPDRGTTFTIRLPLR